VADQEEKTMPEKCAVGDCENGRGPDALEFTIGGEPAGFICDSCVANIPALRVLFSRDKEKRLQAVEVVFVEKPNR
jgi:hypothetical protein